jgi:hypothetical protein
LKVLFEVSLDLQCQIQWQPKARYRRREMSMADLSTLVALVAFVRGCVKLQTTMKYQNKSVGEEKAEPPAEFSGKRA